jgi:hypothetical protein
MSRSIKTLSLLLCFALSSTAFAQATWQGLEFGMDSKKAAEVLSAKGFSILQSSDLRTAILTPDFELKTNSSFLSANLRDEVATAPMFLKPELTFDEHGKLETVNLSLDQENTFQTTPALKGMRAFFSIFSTMVGAIEIARMLPEPAMRERVLASARDLLLRSF